MSVTLYHLDSIPPDDIQFKWSGNMAVPKVGDKVEINMNNLGSGVVTGYFIEYGWLGVYVKLNPKTRPAWHKKQNPTVDYAMVFGLELKEDKPNV